MPRARSAGVAGRPTISPTARMSPVVSAIVTSMTSTMTSHGTSGTRRPKWNGVLIPTQPALPDLREVRHPDGIAATAVPATMPTSTAVCAGSPWRRGA